MRLWPSLAQLFFCVLEFRYLRKIRESAYWGKVRKYFLIDDSVRSGKEMLAGIVKRDGVGTLVGSRTAGYFLGASPFRFFHDKYFLLLAVGDGTVPVLPGIGRIEGVGVTPDVFVEPCRMYCAEHHPVLERPSSWYLPAQSAGLGRFRSPHRCATPAQRILAEPCHGTFSVSRRVSSATVARRRDRAMFGRTRSWRRRSPNAARTNRCIAFPIFKRRPLAT